MRKIRWGRWLPVLAVGGLVWWWLGRKGAGDGPKFETAKVTRGTISARVVASGTLSPLVSVQVGSQVSGRIQEILVDFDDKVQKGQLLARIDPRLFEGARAEARARFQAARSQVIRAEAQAKQADVAATRLHRLLADRLVAQADVDVADATLASTRADLEAARSAVLQARATMSQAEANLNYTKIIAPMTGMVISRAVEMGQTVAASLSAPILFTIAEDLHKMQLEANIAEADVGKLQEGMPLQFTVDAYPGEKFSGKIRQVRHAPLTVQNVVTYALIADVSNADLRLRPGMTASVEVEFAKRDNVLLVPAAALRVEMPPDVKKPNNVPPEHRVVWVLEQGKPRALAVRVGLVSGTSAEILPEGAPRPPVGGTASGPAPTSGEPRAHEPDGITPTAEASAGKRHGRSRHEGGGAPSATAEKGEAATGGSADSSSAGSPGGAQGLSEGDLVIIDVLGGKGGGSRVPSGMRRIM